MGEGKTTLKELRTYAIIHYNKLSDDACHFNSFVAEAIRNYDPDKITELKSQLKPYIEQIDKLDTEIKQHEQLLGNLLCVIHRDGGQYIAEHGWKKAIKDAESKYYELLAQQPPVEGDHGEMLQ